MLDIIQNEKRGRPFVVQFKQHPLEPVSTGKCLARLRHVSVAGAGVAAASAALGQTRGAAMLQDAFAVASGEVVSYSLAQMQSKMLLKQDGLGPGWTSCSHIEHLKILLGTCLHHDIHGLHFVPSMIQCCAKQRS